MVFLFITSIGASATDCSAETKSKHCLSLLHVGCLRGFVSSIDSRWSHRTNISGFVIDSYRGSRSSRYSLIPLLIWFEETNASVGVNCDVNHVAFEFCHYVL